MLLDRLPSLIHTLSEERGQHGHRRRHRLLLLLLPRVGLQSYFALLCTMFRAGVSKNVAKAMQNEVPDENL